ncbi:uncharacterized protein LOC126631440 [Malus sylvestris]|uniref:uncharacterized protein LOC126631440 n=1 Tax=Malus sylvestris TaxID=3752 RepID=UPI0021ABD938|nr:uncharacterized protein LOC126631440 [Malus sylvestris]
MVAKEPVQLNNTPFIQEEHIESIKMETRSTCARKPAISDDFLVYLQEAKFNSHEEDPLNFKTAIESLNNVNWQEATQLEMDSMNKNKVSQGIEVKGYLVYHIEHILKRFNMEYSNGYDVPMTKGEKLSKDRCPKSEFERKEMASKLYASLVWSLMYAQTARSKSATYFSRGLEEDTLHANTVIQSLNSSSTVAHISGMGMKAIPNISCFCSLRSVNLSNNFIANITPGLLQKSLHTLDLSKNRLSTTEGLRDLTRLRVLDLSYNRISRIGRGLSSCSVLKELYLTGNKISDVEGLHRLLKLTVLDLSFNKITTTRALGQLVANYNSLQAMNLLGNPIQNNIGDEQLRKTVCSLLPKLVYLNKQSIKPQRARGVVTDSVAKAALGNKGWNPRRKSSKKLSQRSASFKNTHALPSKKSSSFPTHGHNTGASVVQQNLSKTKSMVRVSSELPSSSH